MISFRFSTLLSVLLAAVFVSGCVSGGASESESSSVSIDSAADTTETPDEVPSSSVPSSLGPVDSGDSVSTTLTDGHSLVPFEGFGSGTVLVAGSEVLDVLVAETTDQRRQGLMFVEDLNGWDGMWFVFDEPTSGGFWMKNTVMPLSIAWVDARGTVVAVADMEPCVTDDCPTYRPDAVYSFALEVPQGMLGTLGIEVGTQVLQSG